MMLKFDIKAWTLALVLVSSIAIWDFSSRLVLEQMSVENRQFGESYAFKALNIISEEEIIKILRQYSAYDIKEIVEAPVEQVAVSHIGLSDEEQTQQNGKLDKLYVGNVKFELKGIFFDQRRFAVLFKENLENGSVTELRVEQGQTLEQYLISNITENKIYFSFETREIELAIFN